MMQNPGSNKLIHNPSSPSSDESIPTSLLDLPELALELILLRLSPADLCCMGGVCTYLRDKCRSDLLWEKHMKEKWGRLIGNVAYKEWHWYMVSNKRRCLLDSLRESDQGVLGSFLKVWPFKLARAKVGGGNEGSLQVDSIMALYISLEGGKFCFPAQVYNRENGHDGFLLSCYDAKMSYDFRTDIFQARYSPCGRVTVEENISWNRLRAPPVDTPPFVLHVSDCLDDLKPGDHFEIQWRRNKDYPYGWWYGVVGHLKSCTGNESVCSCQDNDMVVLEFNQYGPDSRWRQTTINRGKHREEGNEADGFYGGIRKLYNDEEISTWKSIWPTKVLM